MDWNAHRRSPDLSDAQAFFRSTKGETMMASGKTITAGLTTIRRRKINPAGVLERVRLMKRR